MVEAIMGNSKNLEKATRRSTPGAYEAGVGWIPALKSDPFAPHFYPRTVAILRLSGTEGVNITKRHDRSSHGSLQDLPRYCKQ
jgi:hypothetical protein